MFNLKLAVIGIAMGAMLGGCSATTKRVDTSTANILADANSTLAQSDRFNGSERMRVRADDDIYVSGDRIPIEPGLPEVFHQDYAVAMSNIVPLAFAADRLTQLTGFRVNVHEDVYAYFKRQQVASTGGADQQSGQQSASRFTGGSNAVGTDIFVDLSYKGPLTGLLDRIAASLSASWEFDAEAQQIDFFRYQTVSYKINGTHTKEAIQGTVTNASTSKAGSSLTTITAGDLDVFASVERQITAMLTPDGKMSVQSALQTVVVTDTPRVQERVRTYVESLNRDLTREVFIEVKVLTVSLSNGDSRGINFNLLRNTASGGMQFGTVRDVQGFGTLIGSIASGATGALAPYAGSQIIIDALSKQGKVSDVKTIMLRALSGSAAPYQNTRRIGYVSQAGTVFSSATTGTAQTTRQVEFETVGFTMRALPHILDDGKRMLLQLWVSISNLDRLDSVGTGDNIVQIPQVSSNDFQERFGITSGETLVLAGFEANSFNVDSRSMSPNARWWPFGGASNSSVTRDVLVFVITPVIVDGPQPSV
ncbi:hypothetical protein [Sinimarinibacterium sp. CAU 1509]|uniref:hypothetical protein n=1 Tax=Sinimarinibacterium sp. CAU 1509 TaxID=2562283 RepID=UPI00146C8362|nr:hypothetical protein [Sinimarinibacterium sp. CAU 1509]